MFLFIPKSKFLSQQFLKKLIRKQHTFKLQEHALYKLSKGPEINSSISSKDALKYYKEMVWLRKLEKAAASLYRSKHIRGFCHLYSGQEAVAVGLKAAMQPQDTAITSYRAHGWAVLMGVSDVGVLAELTGRQTGCVRGKGGSMHMWGVNFYGGNGIVGSQVPMGTGVAFAHKYRNDNGVCITLYGDGASNQGQVFEAFNLAKLFNLPVLYVCENNLYGIGSAMVRVSSNKELYTKGNNIPGIKFDGMDVLATLEAAKFGLEYARTKGPIIMEALTYRYYGHSMSDPGTSYRTREEIQKVKDTRDPITNFKKKILDAKLVKEEELKKIDKEMQTIIDAAAKAASEDKEPDVKELAYDIYVKNLFGKIRARLPWKPMEHKNLGKLLVPQQKV